MLKHRHEATVLDFRGARRRNKDRQNAQTGAALLLIAALGVVLGWLQ
jgi:hypothetical protein